MPRIDLQAALVLGLLGFSAVVAASKSPASGPSQPDFGEIQRLLDARMGKAAAPEAPATTDGVQVEFQTGHAFGLTAIALSHDGRYLLTGAQDETAKLWDVASGQEVRTFSGFDALGPRSLGFSDDGARLVIADTRGIYVYDTASGARLRTLSGLSLDPLISRDGRFGVDGGSTGLGRSPSLVDLVSGAVLWTLPVEGGAESTLALSDDGRTLVTRKPGKPRRTLSSRPPTVPLELLVWDVAGRRLQSEISIPDASGDHINRMVLSPDGRQLLTQNRNRSLSLYDLASKAVILNIPTGVETASGLTTTLLFSPDGTKVAFATADGHGRIWAVPGGELLASLAASALNFSADGKTIVLGHQGGAPSLRALDSGKETTLTAGAEAILDLAVTSDGRGVLAAMMGGGVRLWDLATAQLTRSFSCADGSAAASVSVSSVAPLVAIGCMDGSVALWDINGGQKVRDLLPPVSPRIAAGALVFAEARFSLDGALLAVAVQNQVTTFNPGTGQQLHQFTLPPSARPALLAAASTEADTAGDNNIQALAIHPDGRSVAIGRAREIALWDLGTGQMLRRLGATAAGSGTATGALPGGLPAGMAGGAGNPMDLLVSTIGGMRDQLAGANSLAFSADGKLLLSVGSQGKRLWNAATGEPLRTAASPKLDATNVQGMMAALLGDEMGEAGGTAFSPDGRLAAHGIGRIVKLTDIATGRDVAQLVGHTSSVSSLAFAAGGRLLVSGGRDGAVRVWSLPEGKQAVAFIALGHSDYVSVTPDQYYRASKSRIKGVAFRVQDQLYPFEQFDLRFNRPDIVLQRLGLAAPETVQAYQYAYQRRLKKTGFTESMLGRDFHLPQLAILGKDLPMTTAESVLRLQVVASDDKFALDRLNVFVNDVPVYGSRGLPLTIRGTQQLEREITAPLVAGRNKVQVSVLNAQGTESLMQTRYVTSTAEQGPADVYAVAIGVSEYQNHAYNLRYAAKDAGDFLNLYRSLEARPTPHGQVHLLEITNSKATRDGIRQAREFLRQARVNDLAVVFVAGHGMTDPQQHYYFGTWDIDPAHPAVNGLPYEDFESLLDGIPALQKMLLIDTCFSGEIDRDEPTSVAQARSSGDGTVKMRAFKTQRGVSVVADSAGAGGSAGNSAGAQDAARLLRFQQDWFADLRRGTGAVVISSASGNEYALEGEQWHNGVFTYALLNGLRNLAADTDKDGTVTVGELQAYVIEQVRALTAGGQNPTVRRENLDYDFAVF